MARTANIARPPVCSCSVRMSGVLGQALGRMKSTVRVASSSKYVRSSHADWRHVKYV